MGLHYDISTTVIDINFSIRENLDLPCKNILLLMIASYLSENVPPWQKNLLHWKLDREMSISLTCHEICITSLLLDDIPGRVVDKCPMFIFEAIRYPLSTYW